MSNKHPTWKELSSKHKWIKKILKDSKRKSNLNKKK